MLLHKEYQHKTNLKTVTSNTYIVQNCFYKTSIQKMVLLHRLNSWSFESKAFYQTVTTTRSKMLLFEIPLGLIRTLQYSGCHFHLVPTLGTFLLVVLRMTKVTNLLLLSYLPEAGRLNLAPSLSSYPINHFILSLFITSFGVLVWCNLLAAL